MNGELFTRQIQKIGNKTICIVVGIMALDTTERMFVGEEMMFPATCKLNPYDARNMLGKLNGCGLDSLIQEPIWRNDLVGIKMEGD